jgi:hypothetical protein
VAGRRVYETLIAANEELVGDSVDVPLVRRVRLENCVVRRVYVSVVRRARSNCAGGVAALLAHVRARNEIFISWFKKGAHVTKAVFYTTLSPYGIPRLGTTLKWH